MSQALRAQSDEIVDLLAAVEHSVLSGKEVQLLVDDAEILDESALLLLQRLAAGNGQCRCRVFLFGEPALQSLLQEQAGDGEGLDYHLIELEPWDIDEVEGYLQQRLQAAGSDLDVFTGQELHRLLEQGQGWPGVINQVAQELLLARLDEETQSVERPAALIVRGKSPLPYRYLVALLLVVFLFMLALYQLDGSDREVPAADRSIHQSAIAQEPDAPLPQIREQGQRRVVLDLPPVAEPEHPVALPATIELEAQGRQVQPVAQPQPQPQPIVQEVVPQPPVVVPVVVEEQPVVVSKPETAPVRPAAVTPPPEPVKPRVAAAIEAHKPAAPASAANWYAAQSAQHYTLQLFATSSEAKARQFVQKNGSQFHYFTKLHQGKPLYVVTHGRFANSGAAREAIARLPESLRSNQPWPRTFASIRQEMR